MSLTNRIRVGFALPLILGALVGMISFRTAAQIPEATRWVEHAQQVLAQVRQLTGRITELVNAQRSALGGAQVADPQFHALTAAVEEQLKALRDLTANNPAQQRRLSDLGKDLARWNSIVEAARTLRASRGTVSMAELLKSTEVKNLGERVRVGLRELDAAESRQLQQRHQLAKASAEQAMYVIGFGTAAAILFGVLAAVYIPKRVTNPVRELVQAVEQIGAGTLGYTTSPKIADELGALATAINAMSFNLQRAREELQTHASALSNERNLLRTLIDHLPEYIFVKDTDHRFVVANAALLRNQGIADPTQIRGTTDFDYYPRHMAESYRQSDEVVLHSGQPMFNIEEPIIDENGRTAWVSTTKVPLRDEKGTLAGLVGICHDITERKNADEQIKQLNRDLRLRALDLESVNKELEAFSYSVSHDLRAPLRHIDGFADLLVKKAGPALDENGRRYVNLIARSAKEAGHLIDDLLSFSRMGRVEMRATRISLDDMFGNVIRELDQGASERKVSWKVSALPCVEGDPAMLRLAVMNLLSNAVKYSRTRDQAEIEIGSYENDPSEIVTFVRDNGVGFDMRYAAKLFGVFQRLHSTDDFEGSGIGLANVRRIIHRHGGRTWAEGVQNEGATFYFSLPRSPEAS